MRPAARWCVAITGSAALFAVGWVASARTGLDTATSVGVASAVLVIIGPFLGWWAARDPGNCRDGAGPAGRSTHAASLAQATGNAAQAVAGSPAVVIGGRARTRGMTVNVGQNTPLPPPPAGPGGETGPVVIGDVPGRPAGYQPREDLLAALRAGPAGPGGVAVVHAVTGMRGTGKTQLAAAYAREQIAAGWRLVAWVNAETTATLLDGLAAAATALAVPPAKDLQATAVALRHRLETDGRRCLLVLDNAAGPAALRPLLPAAGDAQVIITSTRQDITDLGAPVPVDVFTEAEALAYLAGRTGLNDRDGARQVAAELGWLPLALAQAAAVITSQRLDYRAYLHRLTTLPAGDYLTATCSPSLRMSMTATLRVGMSGCEMPRRAGCRAGLWWTRWRRGGQSVAAAASSLMAARAEDSSAMVFPAA